MSVSIEFDAVGGPTSGAATTTLTFSHTCTGTNLILFVAASQTGINNPTLTVTYNTVSMTSAGSLGTNPKVELFYLVAPATGAHNVVITSTQATLIRGASTSYTSVKQTSPIDTFSSAQSGSPIAINFTTVANNCWLVAGGDNDNAVTITAGTGTVVRGTDATARFSIADSNSSTSPAGADSLNATFTGGGNQRLVGASFIPVDQGIRYWVGGTGTWDASDTTHWAYTSGGTAGAVAPTSAEAVVFDGNSGGGTATLGANVLMTSLTCTGYTGTLAQSTFTMTLSSNFTGASGMTWTGSGADSITGNMTLVAGMTSTYSGILTFNSTSTGKTLTTASVSLTNSFVFNGVGGGWTLQDAITTSSNITLTNGSLNLNDKNISCNIFSGNNSNVRTLTMGASTVTLTGTGTAWSCSTSTNFTLSSGTSTIKFTNASSTGKTFAGGSLTYNNIWLTGSGTGTFTIAGSNMFADFKVDTPPHTVKFTAGTTQKIQTFTVNGTAGNLMTLQSTVNGSNWYLKKITAGTVVCDYLSLQDSHVS